MSERVKEAVVEEVDRVKALSQEAARSGAYLYPLKVSAPMRSASSRFICADQLIIIRASPTSARIVACGSH